MKSKKGKILKVVPGINPNCSSGMFAMGYMIFSIPVYLVINIVTNVILFKKRNKQKAEKDIDVFSISRSIKKLKYSILLAVIIWMGFLIITLSVERHYGYIGTWILAGLMISYPLIALIISLLIGEKILHSRIPRGVFVISPLLYLAIVAILWLLSGVIYALIRNIVS